MRGSGRPEACPRLVSDVPAGVRRAGAADRAGRLAAAAGQRGFRRCRGAVAAVVAGTGRAGAAGLCRRLLGGHRHGHRRQRRAEHHDQQRPGHAVAGACAQTAPGPRRRPVARGVVGAPHRHRRAGGAGVRLLSFHRAFGHAGGDGPACLCGGCAVHAGDARRPVLEWRQPDRRHGRTGVRLCRLVLHVVAADFRACRLAARHLVAHRSIRS